MQHSSVIFRMIRGQEEEGQGRQAQGGGEGVGHAPYDPEAYEVEVEEVKGVEITARRGKKTVGVFSTYMAIF